MVLIHSHRAVRALVPSLPRSASSTQWFYLHQRPQPQQRQHTLRHFASIRHRTIPAHLRRYFYTIVDALAEIPDPQAVLVGEQLPHLGNRRFFWVGSHKELFGSLTNAHDNLSLCCFHEYVLDFQPRCLFFDLDGSYSRYSKRHELWVQQLTTLVHQYFSIDSSTAQPTVLRARYSDKYSSHLIYPYIQFRDHWEQMELIPLLLDLIKCARFLMQENAETNAEVGSSTAASVLSKRALSSNNSPNLSFVVEPSIPSCLKSYALPDLHDQQQQNSSDLLLPPRLADLVDRQVYRSNVSLRTPYSCKMIDSVPSFKTILLHDQATVFANDALTGFVGYCKPEYKLDGLPHTLSDVIAGREELEKLLTRFRRSTSASSQRFVLAPPPVLVSRYSQFFPRRPFDGDNSGAATAAKRIGTSGAQSGAGCSGLPDSFDVSSSGNTGGLNDGRNVNLLPGMVSPKGLELAMSNDTSVAPESNPMVLTLEEVNAVFGNQAVFHHQERDTASSSQTLRTSAPEPPSAINAAFEQPHAATVGGTARLLLLDELVNFAGLLDPSFCKRMNSSPGSPTALVASGNPQWWSELISPFVTPLEDSLPPKNHNALPKNDNAPPKNHNAPPKDGTDNAPPYFFFFDVRGMDLSPIEVLKLCLDCIALQRVSQWTSWWHVARVTAGMLCLFPTTQLQTEIWMTFLCWSRRSEKFILEENVSIVLRNIEIWVRGNPLPSIESLFNVVEFDNPSIQFRWPNYSNPK